MDLETSGFSIVCGCNKWGLGEKIKEDKMPTLTRTVENLKWSTLNWILIPS